MVTGDSYASGHRYERQSVQTGAALSFLERLVQGDATARILDAASISWK